MNAPTDAMLFAPVDRDDGESDQYLLHTDEFGAPAVVVIAQYAGWDEVVEVRIGSAVIEAVCLQDWLCNRWVEAMRKELSQ